jgi:hypothetical protein
MANQNLRFFDSESNDLNLLYNSETNIWEGVCYLPKVSTGLYETLTIYILEQVEGKLGGDKFITPIGASFAGNKFKFKFFSGYEFSEDIFMYSAKNNNGVLEIQKDEVQIHPILDSTTATGTNGDGFKIIGSNIPMIPIKCNIALMSQEDNYHTRILDIYEIAGGEGEMPEELIASIRIYGETESEDERLGVLLSNMGMSLSEEEYLILKDSNILEFSPDWILMNQKRKELLLQASEIKPFVGTYKALLNAIDFYGYNKITIKEYWLNINEQAENFGKLQAIAIPNQDSVGFLANKNQGNQLPSSNLKKTSRFSLVYRLNEADGGVDEWDIPTVVESTDYSPDEVLIKLYGLKNKLQEKYLPLQSKIVDITGEGDYFAQFSLNVWNNQHSIKDQTAGQMVDFSRYPKERQLFIEDLRKVDYRLTGINQDFSALSEIDREEISESMINFYNGYYNDDLSSFNTLDGIPVGCPVILNADSFIGSWDSAEFTWLDAGKDYTGGAVGYNFFEDFPPHPTNASGIRPNTTCLGNSCPIPLPIGTVPVGTPPTVQFTNYDYLYANEQYNLLTWNNWWRQGIYEMEWTILGPRGYSNSFRGPVGYYDVGGNFHPQYQQFPIVLPYAGTYSVELSIFDLYNVRSSYRKPDYFEVKNKNVEVYGIFQRMLPQLNWNEYKYSYDVAGSDWDWARENTIDVDSVIATYYLTLDRANYTHDEEDGPEFSTVRRYVDPNTVTGFNETAGPYQWRELRTQLWEDGEEVNWDMMRVGADINSSFKIDLRQSEGYNNGYIFFITQYDVNSNQLVTDSYPIQSPYPIDEFDLSAWNDIADELSQLDPVQHPILTKFNYNPILVDTDNDGTEDICEYILVVAEEPSRTHDYFSVGFNDPTGGEVVAGSELHFESYNPNYQDLCVIDSHMEVKRLNHVTFSYDTTNMPGIIAQRWTLKNNNENVNDIYYSNTWLTYLFKYKGDYTIELELTDVNGNKNTINKNILKII